MPDPKETNPDQTPIPAPTWKPPVEEPETEDLPDEKRDPNPDENRDPPINAGGAPGQSVDALPDPFPGRKSDASRQAGMTPRPTSEPIE